GIRSLADVGLLGILIPRALGGGGADTLSFVLATEAIAKSCASTALIFVTHVSAGLGVLIGGSDAQKNEYLPLMARGERLGAFAVTEAASGANPLAIETTARSMGDEYAVNGSKIFITSGGEADTYLVLVRTDRGKGPEGISMLIIDKDTSGFSIGEKDDGMGLRGTSRHELIFEDCHVPRGNLVGQEGEGVQLAMAVGGTAALGAAAISLGIAQAAVDASIQHAKERHILGSPIGMFEGIQYLITDMSVAVDAARALLFYAVFQKEQVPPSPLAAYKAKLHASEMAVAVTQKALQVHGGHGYSKELPIERYYRDARGLTLHFSTSEMLKELIGKMLMGLGP
ncbi:MAG: acyl-CoA dehydrogenase family protein, partial [Candidatus Geothermarchaeales archaeon]